MKDDKKKLLVLAALAVAVVAVGAFQFTGGSGAPPPTAENKAEETKVEPTPTEGLVAAKEPINPLFAQPLAARDPFATGALPGANPVVNPTPVKVPEPKPVRPSREIRPPTDFPSGGAIRPFNVSGSLPRAEDGSVKVEAAPEVFGYSLSGIVLGDSPAAVFTDGAGNQRLVTSGSALDGDSRVVGIARGKVTVRWKKKTMTLTLGGTADAK